MAKVLLQLCDEDLKKLTDSGELTEVKYEDAKDHKENDD
jgi:hypothetical protein